MAQHASTRLREPFIRKRGLIIRSFDNHLQIGFGLAAKPWPTIWKRVRLAGYEVSVTNLRKPILHVSTDLDTFLALLEPRSSRGKRHNLKFVAVTSGLGLVFAAVLVPLPTPEAKPRLELKESNPCSLAEIKKAISGATEDSKIEFLGAETFGGVTSGSLLCEGLKYSYALESKGLERVLKVRRLDS